MQALPELEKASLELLSKPAVSSMLTVMLQRLHKVVPDEQWQSPSIGEDENGAWLSWPTVFCYLANGQKKNWSLLFHPRIEFNDIQDMNRAFTLLSEHLVHKNASSTC